MRAILFRNKSDESVVLLPKKLLILQEIPNTIQNIFFDNRPILLVKEINKTIRFRGLGRSETGEGLNHFNFRGDGAQIKIIFSGDGRGEQISNSSSIIGLMEEKRFEK